MRGDWLKAEKREKEKTEIDFYEKVLMTDIHRDLILKIKLPK